MNGLSSLTLNQMNVIETSQLDVIQTGLGEFSRRRFDALVTVRFVALTAIRNFLINEGFSEVTTATLVNIAGSCENPYSSFTLNYYGREAHLSQSAQLQLEALVIRLRRKVFSVTGSFREENYDDPEAKGRRLSEFTLIEPEWPMDNLTPDEALDCIIKLESSLLKHVVKVMLDKCEDELNVLGSDLKYLESVLYQEFIQITYDEALALLNRQGGSYAFGVDLGVKEERALLAANGWCPTFVTHYPAAIKFFNMKRTGDGQRVYSVDLLTPRLGETSGGAVREEQGGKIREYLLSSRIAEYIGDKGGDPLQNFDEYLQLFEQEQPTVRGGFGIGFERFIGFLLNSNDIIETVAHRSLRPRQ